MASGLAVGLNWPEISSNAVRAARPFRSITAMPPPVELNAPSVPLSSLRSAL